MNTVKLKEIKFGGVKLNIPEVWNAHTETYTEPDGRECAMIENSAEDGDPRSIVISYGSMPEDSDALMEAGGTYEEIIGEIGPEIEDDPICEYDFLGTQDSDLKYPQKIIWCAISSAQKSVLRQNAKLESGANYSLS